MIAILQAILVTILWSSSFVIIKYGLEGLSPIIFAGMRYSAASVILIAAVLVSPKYRDEVSNLTSGWWLKLLFYGLIFYTFTQGLMFIGLSLLPAITVSFVLNFTLIFVLILATFVLKEIPNKKQIIIVIFAFLGGVIYFYPLDVIDESKTGLLIITLAMLFNAIASIYGRYINRSRLQSPLTITAISMGAGSLILLIWGVIAEGLPNLKIIDIVYILWLSLLNTALAFTLWNKAMQNLQATEITIINGLMLPEITILAILFLDEYPSILDWFGIIIITMSAFLIQFFRSPVNSNQ